MAHILVVEDDPAIAELVRLYLARDGHAVELVANGARALRHVETAAPDLDLIVLDLMLPGLDGRGLCRRIRAATGPAAHPDIPIIMLTALDDPRDKIEGLDLGADDYLTKPFDPDELLARVRALLRRAHRPAPPSLAHPAPHHAPIALGNARLDPGARRLLVALAVAALAGYWLSRRLAAPVDRLTLAADAMAAGDLDQRVPGEGLDEIGRLVASFNAMSRRVAATAREQRDFLANVAHELRTPLTSVRGYARALRDGVAADPADRDRALATIAAESERMAALVQGLLDLARLESGQTHLHARPIAARTALDSLAHRFAPDAAHRGVALTVDAPSDVRLYADPARLAQILDNLVANALRHTPAGGRVAVTAAPHRFPDATPAVRLTVEDSGEGIPPEIIPTIFDRFTRGPAPGTGAGLGLAIVRELVHAHRGTIAVASTPGHGTVFTLDLPAASS